MGDVSAAIRRHGSAGRHNVYEVGLNVSELFRTEVDNIRSRALEGDVIVTPVPLNNAVAIISTIMTISLLIFAGTARFTTTQTIQGWIVPEGGLIRISAQKDAVITALRAHEGERVKAGQVIADLRVTTALPAGASRDAESKYLNTEISAKLTQFDLAATKLRDQYKSLVQRHDDLALEGQRLDSELAGASRHLQLANSAYQRDEEFEKSGFASPAWLEIRSDSLVAARQAQTELQIRRLENDRATRDIAAEIDATNADLRSVNQQKLESSASASRLKLTDQGEDIYQLSSPINGRLAALPANDGQTVSPNSIVAIVVPDGSDMIAEAYAPSRSVGALRVGQTVRLRYSAFPYQRYGFGHGRITTISKTALSPNDLDQPAPDGAEPMFRVKVELQRPFPTLDGKEITVAPGMSLTADITTGHQTLTQMLFGPLKLLVGRNK